MPPSIVLNSKFNFIGALFLLGMLTFGAYFPVSDAGTIIDDSKFYLDDPLVNAGDGWRQIWFNPLQNNGVWPYIPLTRSSFWLERQIFGVNFRISHWLNVIFHFMSAVLLWQILRNMKLQGAWMIGMCFAIHPLHVQSVAWITERKNVLAGVFFMLTFWAFLQFDEKKEKHWYWCTLILYACALLSKSSTIMLPLLFVIYRMWRGTSWNKAEIRGLLPFFLLAGGSACTRIWFELHSFGASGEAFARSFSERLLTAAHIPYFYLSKIFFPHPLIFTYPKWVMDPAQVSHYFPLVSIFLSMGLLLLKYREWGRALFLCLAAYGILLFPVLGFFNNAWTKFSFVTDHWAYLPSIPVFIFSIQGSLKLAEKGLQKKSWLAHHARWWSMALFGSILFALTWNQVAQYKDRQTLWQATLSNNPNAWLAYGELALEYAKKKQYKEALAHYNQAISLYPDYWEAYSNRANLFAGLNQQERALADYDKAISLDPGSWQNYSNRGNIFSRLNRLDRALEDYNKAIALGPHYAEAHFNRGNLFLKMGKNQQALEDYNKGLHLKANAKAYVNRGHLFARMRQYSNAAEDFTRAIKLAPDFADARYSRGIVFLNTGEYKRALEDFNEAVRLLPGMAKFHYSRGITHDRMEQHERALEDFNLVIKLQHEFRGVYYNRGNTYFKLQQYEKALEDYDRSLRAHPNVPASYYNRGEVFRALKQYKRAIEDYSKVLEINPEDARAYNSRGLVHQEKNEKNLACSNWQSACNLGQCQYYAKAKTEMFCP
ncbi:MAG: tetratricopeptide repeat protein [SAR324 cluster bacterium]|nr:tetratricopeptide repeat protein [SAR324 cluster bacterium]